jgi:hypothetical protein
MGANDQQLKIKKALVVVYLKVIRLATLRKTRTGAKTVGKEIQNKKFWEELTCLLSLHYFKMSFALNPAFAPT